MEQLLRCIRYTVRTAVLALAGYLAYVHVHTPHLIELTGLVLVFGLLGLVFLGTFAISLKSNKELVGGNGMPPYLSTSRLLFCAAMLMLVIGVAGLASGQTRTWSRHVAKTVERSTDPQEYWSTMTIDFVAAGAGLVAAYATRRKHLAKANHDASDL